MSSATKSSCLLDMLCRGGDVASAGWAAARGCVQPRVRRLNVGQQQGSEDRGVYKRMTIWINACAHCVDGVRSAHTVSRGRLAQRCPTMHAGGCADMLTVSVWTTRHALMLP